LEINKGQFLKKFIEYATGNFFALFLGFIASPIITRLIMPEEMGKFSLFNTITSVLFLFVMCGLDQSYVRFYNTLDSKGKRLLFNNCTIISLLVGTGASVIIFFFYAPISKYICGQINFTVTFLLVVNIISSILQRFALLELRMGLRAKLYSLLNIWHKMSYILLVFGTYYFFKNDSCVLMIATVGSNFACWIVCILFSRKTWMYFFSNMKIQQPTGHLLKFGFPFIFSNTINWIFEYIDRISVKYYCDFNELGIYSAAGTIVALLTACQLAFSTFWVPVAYEKYEKDPCCNSFFITMNRIVSFWMIVIATLLITFKDLIIILLGPAYKNAMFIFPFLTYMPIMYTISETTVLGINFQMKTRYHIYIAILSAIVNLCGNTILVPLLGAKGAAISTGFSYVVFFLIRTYLSNRCYPVKYKLKSLIVSLILLNILTIYSSFNNVNIYSIALACVVLIVVAVLYKDVIELTINYFKNFWLSFREKE